MAQDSPPQGHLSQRTPSVVATVNDVALLAAEVDARLSQVPAEDRQHQRTTMLAILIDEELVRQYLAERSRGASEQELDQAMRRWQKRMTSEYSSPAAYYARTGLDESAVRRRWAWQIGWPRFVDKQLTDERLGDYFEKHRRDFDGSVMHVAHILWSSADSSIAGDSPTESTLADRQAAAATVRERIVQGELTFAQAAAQYSAAPSAKIGGEIGPIERHHPMEPIFSAAAFKLKENEISQPIVSPFGVHLIRCLKLEAGDRTLDDCRSEVTRAAHRRLFQNLANRQRRAARIDVRAPITVGQDGQLEE